MAYYFEDLVFEVPQSVYEPSEDSIMLAGFSKKAHGSVLDVGCGSGIQAIVCAKANPNAKVIGVDINADAIFAAKQNAENNKATNCQFFVSDMFSAVAGSKFDFIIFNPPYLPTSKSEKIKGGLNLAVDGGLDGRKVIDRFIAGAPAHLNAGGKILMLDSSLDNTEKTLSSFSALGMGVRTLQKLSIFFETLSVLEISANPAPTAQPAQI